MCVHYKYMYIWHTYIHDCVVYSNIFTLLIYDVLVLRGQAFQHAIWVLTVPRDTQDGQLEHEHLPYEG